MSKEIVTGAGSAAVAAAATLGILLQFGGPVGAEPIGKVAPPPAPIINVSLLPDIPKAPDVITKAKIQWTDEADFKQEEIKKTIKKTREQIRQGGQLVIDGVNQLAKYITGATSPQALKFTLTALEQMGKPYVWAATGPDSFDCSGLIQYAATKNGISVPRVAIDQANSGRQITRAELRPGDLIRYNGGSHIGIYIGGGKTLHAPQTGDVVRIQPMEVVGTMDQFTRIA